MAKVIDFWPTFPPAAFFITSFTFVNGSKLYLVAQSTNTSEYLDFSSSHSTPNLWVNPGGSVSRIHPQRSHLSPFPVRTTSPQPFTLTLCKGFLTSLLRPQPWPPPVCPPCWNCLLFFFWLCGMWDPSSLTKDQTCAPCNGNSEF